MKPARTPTSNTKLVLEGAGDLPAEKIDLYPPGSDPADPDVKGRPGWETFWVPDDGERRALANGAPVVLHLWGDGHPPVSVGTGDPVELRAMVSKAHVDRAVGYWWAAVSEKWLTDGEQPSAADVLELWHEALDETRALKDDAADEPPTNGAGP